MLGAYLTIFFINAQTDLGVKILLQNSLFKVYSHSALLTQTTLLNLLFLLPFVLFSPVAGYLSDRFRKVDITYWIAVAGLAIVGGLLYSFWAGNWPLSLFLAFLLALQSAVYSPAKYGLIRELFGEERVLQINSLVQTLTIVAILGGSLFYGLLFESTAFGVTLPTLLRTSAPILIVLIGLGIVEVISALRLRRHSPTSPSPRAERFTLSPYLPIIGAIALFWGISQFVVVGIGEFLKTRFQITNSALPQVVIAVSGVGLIGGAILAGFIGRRAYRLVPVGAGIMGVSLFGLPLLPSIGAVMGASLLYGIGAGLYLIPLNARLQLMVPISHLGKVIGVSNQFQYLAMVGVLGIVLLFSQYGIDSSPLFQLAGGVMGVAAILVRRLENGV